MRNVVTGLMMLAGSVVKEQSGSPDDMAWRREAQTMAPEVHEEETVTVVVGPPIGTADGIVPLSRSRVLHEAWPGPKQWLALEGAGHNNLSMSVEFWDGLNRYLASVPQRS